MATQITITQDASTPATDIYAHRHRILLKKYLAVHDDEVKQLPGLEDMIHLFPKPSPLPTTPGGKPSEATERIIGIVGAGTAGLYTAMILQSLGIKYKILEASDRVGGRLWTYRFSEPGYEYYDVGAMRYPDTPFMKRTFDLVRNRNLDIKLIDYYFQSDNTFRCYNGISYDTAPDGVDPFKVKDYIRDDLRTIPGVQNLLKRILAKPRKLFQDYDISTAVEKLFEQYDSFSMRSWVADQDKTLTTSDILWLETIDKSTGWYDRALTETVLESCAFDWPGDSQSSGGSASTTQTQKLNWYCFDGGSSRLPEAMQKTLNTTIQFNSTVTKISEWEEGKMLVTYKNKHGKETKEYFSAVICTAPLPRLSFMDLRGSSIMIANYPQWSAIRQLRYGPSIKIAIRFKTPWWETLDTGKIVGGQSYTDLPIRTVVYPSYPPEKSSKSPVLIVSYCWTADAERLTALIREGGKADPALIPLVLRDLALVHKISVDDLMQYYDDDPKNYHAWSWVTDPLTAGAFAFFGPGEYSDPMYPKLRAPAARGKLFFAGEALSACHAWVAGALNSSWHAVRSYLTLWDEDKLDEFMKNWGETEPWDEEPEHKKQDTDCFHKELKLGLSYYAKHVPIDI